MDLSPVARSVMERHDSHAQALEVLKVPGALLKLATVRQIVGLSASTVYRKIADSEFPAPVRLGTRCSRWRSDDVRNWLAKHGSA